MLRNQASIYFNLFRATEIVLEYFQAPKPGTSAYGEWNSDSPFDKVPAYKDTPIGCTWGLNSSPAYPNGEDANIKNVMKVWGQKLGYSGSPGVIVCQCEVRKSTY